MVGNENKMNLWDIQIFENEMIRSVTCTKN
jgi:hypothetical protein